MMVGTSLLASRADAVTLRYSLVIGNNVGVDKDGIQPFEPLLHAEREAAVLRDRLVKLANFDAAEDRTVLLQGATRAQVLEAAQRIAARKAADSRQYGRVDSLFVFFFTGHGLQGRLLLNDGPLTLEELAAVFQMVDATFRIGVFDACYSGSLDPMALSEKGVELTPGINLFGKLPEEVLSAEGSIWLVSSGSGEVSYEDKDLGGVFTHFFTEALERAPVDGPGITLDSVWSYARRKTVAYTSRRRRRQVPQQFVAKLKARGPLYFSFPVARSARLVLADSLEGRFLLSYAEGQLVETIDKQPGRRQEVPVYPGSALLSYIKDDQVFVQESLQFVAGTPVLLRSSDDLLPAGRPGERARDLWAKGLGDNKLVATVVRAESSGMLGLSFTQVLSGRGFLAPERLVLMSARLDRGRFVLSAAMGYGWAEHDFEDWSHDVDAWHGEVRAGFAHDLGLVRLALGAGIASEHFWQRYRDGATRRAWLFQPAAYVALLVPNRHRVTAALTCAGGPAWAPGVGRDTLSQWSLRADLGLSVMMRF
jgi:hypothetical protein